MKQMDGLRTLVKQLRADNAALQDSVRQHEAEAKQQNQEVRWPGWLNAHWAAQAYKCACLRLYPCTSSHVLMAGRGVPSPVAAGLDFFACLHVLVLQPSEGRVRQSMCWHIACR